VWERRRRGCEWWSVAGQPVALIICSFGLLERSRFSCTFATLRMGWTWSDPISTSEPPAGYPQTSMHAAPCPHHMVVGRTIQAGHVPRQLLTSLLSSTNHRLFSDGCSAFCDFSRCLAPTFPDQAGHPDAKWNAALARSGLWYGRLGGGPSAMHRPGEEHVTVSP
jgi:hypothetical protein